VLRAVPLLAVFAIAAEPATAPKPSLDFATVPSIAQLRAVKFLPVPADVALHRFEERGFVAVPLDFARRSESPTLRIFCRLVPVRGSTARGTKAPIAVGRSREWLERISRGDVPPPLEERWQGDFEAMKEGLTRSPPEERAEERQPRRRRGAVAHLERGPD